ncbi:MAG: phosphoribosylanthranilate isomerase, partial [Elusimicrobia bacterium]|nr:phosphoribosylanthranilate isomerase [Elusimicrobiota bacterium]
MTRVKICGITRPEDARLAAEAGVWAIGLNFCGRGPRSVTVGAALRIVAALPGKVLRVGVFMDQPLSEIRRIEGQVPLDLIQLHGHEPAELCRELGPDRCMKTVVLKTAAGVEQALDIPAAFLLADRARSGPEAGAEPGTADWELAGRLARRRTRTMLAGGLTPEMLNACPMTGSAGCVRCAMPPNAAAANPVNS